MCKEMFGEETTSECSLSEFSDSGNLLSIFAAAFLRETSRLSPDVSMETLHKTEPDLLLYTLSTIEMSQTSQ